MSDIKALSSKVHEFWIDLTAHKFWMDLHSIRVTWHTEKEPLKRINLIM